MFPKTVVPIPTTTVGHKNKTLNADLRIFRGSVDFIREKGYNKTRMFMLKR